MLKYLINLLKAFNANIKPSQIANSFCIGLILGFMPKNNLLWFILMIFFAFVRINKPGYFIMVLVGSCFASLLDPFFDVIGYAVLTFEPMQPFYAKFLEIPFIAFTRFNNTIVCGSLIFGIVSYIPLYAIMFFIVKAWRKWIAPKFNDSKVLKTIYKIPLLAKIASKVSASV